MKTVLIIVGALVVLMVGGYLYLRSDLDLLGDETLLKIASTDVFDNKLYGKTCPRSSYAKDVEIPAGPNKGESAFFKFQPVPGMEEKCPPVSILMDRRTGEAWIGDSQTQPGNKKIPAK